MQSGLTIHVGVDPRHDPALITHYYPPALPEDWRAAYLMNEFDALRVGADDADAAQICAELTDAPSHQWVMVAPELQSLDWPTATHTIVFADQTGSAWQPNVPDQAQTPWAVVPAGGTPAQLRAIIEAFVTQLPENTHRAAILVKADAKAATTATEIKTMAKLMGLA